MNKQNNTQENTAALEPNQTGQQHDRLNRMRARTDQFRIQLAQERATINSTLVELGDQSATPWKAAVRN